MTPIEDELRNALALLEQRAPDEAALWNVPHHRSSPHRVVFVLAAAVVVAVIAVASVAFAHRSRPDAAPAVASHPTTAPPAPAKLADCAVKPKPRAGGTKQMVPPGAVSVTVCQSAYGARSRIATTHIGALVSALNALPDARLVKHRCESDSAALFPPLVVGYGLVFSYATGPNVVVDVASDNCPFTNSAGLAAHDTTGATFATLARIPGVASASLTVTLNEVGGPAPGTPRSIGGRVRFVNANTHVAHQFVITHGYRTVSVLPGSYVVTGYSPSYNSGQIACTAPRTATVGALRATTADITCQVK